MIIKYGIYDVVKGEIVYRKNRDGLMALPKKFATYIMHLGDRIKLSDVEFAYGILECDSYDIHVITIHQKPDMYNKVEARKTLKRRIKEIYNITKELKNPLHWTKFCKVPWWGYVTKRTESIDDIESIVEPNED